MVNGVLLFQGEQLCKLHFSCFLNGSELFTLVHSERSKLHTILAFLSAVGLKDRMCSYTVYAGYIYLTGVFDKTVAIYHLHVKPLVSNQFHC